MKKIENNNSQLDYSRTYQDQKDVAAFMDSQTGNILLDTTSGFAIPLFAKNPQQYIITPDTDFLTNLTNFPNSVNWIIMHNPSLDSSNYNIINHYYPKMWQGKTPGISLRAEINDWRIYKIDHNQTSANQQ